MNEQICSLLPITLIIFHRYLVYKRQQACLNCKLSYNNHLINALFGLRLAPRVPSLSSHPLSRPHRGRHEALCCVISLPLSTLSVLILLQGCPFLFLSDTFNKTRRQQEAGGLFASVVYAPFFFPRLSHSHTHTQKEAEKDPSVDDDEEVEKKEEGEEEEEDKARTSRRWGDRRGADDDGGKMRRMEKEGGWELQRRNVCMFIVLSK